MSDSVLTRFREIADAVQRIQHDVEKFDFALDRAQSPAEKEAVRAQHITLQQNLARLQDERFALACEQVERDLRHLEQSSADEAPVVLTDEVEASVMLCAFASVESYRVTWWLCQHVEGAEAVLAVVARLSREGHLFELRGLDYLPPEHQIQVLARAANALGRARLERACTRLLRSRTCQRDQLRARVQRDKRRATPPTPASVRSLQQAEKALAGHERGVQRLHHVLALVQSNAETSTVTANA